MLTLSYDNELVQIDISDNAGRDEDLKDEESNSSIESLKVKFELCRNCALNASKDEYYALKESWIKQIFSNAFSNKTSPLESTKKKLLLNREKNADDSSVVESIRNEDALRKRDQIGTDSCNRRLSKIELHSSEDSSRKFLGMNHLWFAWNVKINWDCIIQISKIRIAEELDRCTAKNF